MFELILNTIRENLQKAKQEIIVEVLRSTSRDNAELRCDLLELKQMLRSQSKPYKSQTYGTKPFEKKFVYSNTKD